MTATWSGGRGRTTSTRATGSRMTECVVWTTRRATTTGSSTWRRWSGSSCPSPRIRTAAGAPQRSSLKFLEGHLRNQLQVGTCRIDLEYVEGQQQGLMST